MKDEREKFSDNCALLVALLDDHRRKVIGLDQVTTDEKLRVLINSAAEVMLHTLAIFTSADYDIAVEGLRFLKLERRLRQVCNIMELQLKEKGYD